MIPDPVSAFFLAKYTQRVAHEVEADRIMRSLQFCGDVTTELDQFQVAVEDFERGKDIDLISLAYKLHVQAADNCMRQLAIDDKLRTRPWTKYIPRTPRRTRR